MTPIFRLDRKQLEDLVFDMANAYRLPYAVLCGICERESSWNPYSIRPEPGFLRRYEQRLDISMDEKIARSMSYGLMQLMGENAREMGFSGQLSSLCAPASGLRWGVEYFRKIFNRCGGDTYKALQEWNGGGNPNYASEVMKLAQNYAG